MNRSASVAGRNVRYVVPVVYIDDLPSCHRLLKYNQQKCGRLYKQRWLLEGQKINCSNYKEGVKGMEVVSLDLNKIKTPVAHNNSTLLSILQYVFNGKYCSLKLRCLDHTYCNRTELFIPLIWYLVTGSSRVCDTLEGNTSLWTLAACQKCCRRCSHAGRWGPAMTGRGHFFHWLLHMIFLKYSIWLTSPLSYSCEYR